MEKLDNIAAAYVNRGITVHLAKAGELDKDAIAETIKPFKMQIQDCRALEGKPF